MIYFSRGSGPKYRLAFLTVFLMKPFCFCFTSGLSFSKIVHQVVCSCLTHIPPFLRGYTPYQGSSDPNPVQMAGSLWLAGVGVEREIGPASVVCALCVCCGQGFLCLKISRWLWSEGLSTRNGTSCCFSRHIIYSFLAPSLLKELVSLPWSSDDGAEQQPFHR